jgi:hypothetical protein
VTRIALLLLAVQGLGWIATIAVALTMPGGHPPLSAYVGMIVILAQLGLGPAGALCAGLTLWRAPQPRHRIAVWLALAGNLAFTVQALWLVLRN